MPHVALADAAAMQVSNDGKAGASEDIMVTGAESVGGDVVSSMATPGNITGQLVEHDSVIILVTVEPTFLNRRNHKSLESSGSISARL
jgi:hypothetical protein